MGHKVNGEMANDRALKLSIGALFEELGGELVVPVVSSTGESCLWGARWVGRAHGGELHNRTVWLFISSQDNGAFHYEG